MQESGDRSDKEKNGFTLIELLIVVAIVAVLLSILAPALTKPQEQAKLTFRLHNLHRLTEPWIMYANDSPDLPIGQVRMDD